MDDQRVGRRVDVELPVRWRRFGDGSAPTLALLLNLSVRGAHIAGWNTLRLEINDEVEIVLDEQTRSRGSIRRVIGPGEYGVRFHDVSFEVKQLIVDTMGHARHAPTRWAQRQAERGGNR